MDFENDRREGKIFPELRSDAPESAHQSAEPLSDWRDQPLEPKPELRAREIRPQMVVRDSQHASTGPLWLALTFLLVVLAGASIFGYRTLEDQGIQLNQIPAMLKSMATADGRLNNLESQLQVWSQNWQDLSGRTDKLEQKVSVDYHRARRHAEALTAQLGKQIQDQMDARTKVVDARLEQLDSAQKSEDARVAQLKQELSDAQNEIASLRQETNGDLALLHQHVAGNEQQMNDLSQQVERQRLDFEVTQNRIAELSPEISMDLTATDVRYQRFSGWVYFEPDRRYLWVRDQGVSQPVVFYDQQQAKQYQVVVTSIREGSAAGYLLLPVRRGAIPSEAAGGMPSGR
jgi:predicted  nucleic acid-binding Zn-ribbon protein